MNDGARRLLVSTLYNNNININARTQHAAHYQNVYIRDTGTVDDEMAQCIKQKKRGTFYKKKKKKKNEARSREKNK